MRSKKFDSIKFHINEKDRIVTAFTEDLHYCCKNKSAIMQDDDYITLRNLTDISMLPDKMIAFAMCHPEDDFDAETGMRVAKRKLEDKLYAESIRRMNLVKRFYQKQIEKIEFEISNYKKKHERNKKKIKGKEKN